MHYLKRLFYDVIVLHKLVYGCLILSQIPLSLWAQNNITLRGEVMSAGNPLYEAQVGIKGEAFTVFTNEDGAFALSVADEFPLILQVNLQGYQTANVVVNDGSFQQITLQAGATQNTLGEVVKIFGRVVDDNGQPLRNVNVVAQNLERQTRPVGAITDKNGSFYIFFEDVLPVVLEVSSLGFESQRVVIDQPLTNDLTINLPGDALNLDEVVIRGEKISEEILKADYTIERISVKELQLSPSFDIYDVIASLKDVDVATQSMQFQSVNTRGFNSTGNVRFTQMVDGMDNQAPGFGFPVGNFAGISELDLETIELIPGPSSAEYGLNIFNGVLDMRSKDPFLFQGLSASLKLAANRFPEGGGGSDFFDLGGEPVFDFSLRYAKAFSDKLAFKTNFSIISATDWAANNFDNIGDGERFERHADIPGYDGVNIYGDEFQANLPIGDFGANVIVTRTGYAEEDLFDYEFTNYKLAGAIHYKISEKLRAIVQGNFGTGNTFYTGDNRLFLKDFQIFQGKVELSSERLTLRGYLTQQQTGNSFDGRFLALQLMTNARSHQDWFNVYQAAFQGLLISRGIIGGDHEIARQAADSDIQLTEDAGARFEPGTPEFLQARNRIINTRGFQEGASFKDNTSLYHFQGSYDFTGLIPLMDLSMGVNYRFFDPESSGVIFPDSVGNDITLHEYGGFLQAKRKLMQEQLALSASIRVDKNENFDTKFSPRFSVLYTVAKDHNFRLSFQTGFRFPNLREQFINQDLGSTKLVGGLPFLIEPLGIDDQAFYEQSVEAFNQAVQIDINPDPDVNPVRFNQEQAELKNIAILEQGLVRTGDVTGIRPERIRSIEVGYKSVLADNQVFVDVSYYLNSYKDFIGIIRANKPKTSPGVDLFSSARQINNSTEREVFFIYNNAQDNVRSQGVSFNVDFTSKGGFTVGLNGAWASLTSNPDDPIIPGFNTPKIKLNYTLGHNNIAKNMGFKVILRTRSSFDWESNFGDGVVDEYYNLDFQLNWRLPSIKSMLKFGMSNLGNEYYPNTFGGPLIGALPYIQLTYDPLFY